MTEIHVTLGNVVRNGPHKSVHVDHCYAQSIFFWCSLSSSDLLSIAIKANWVSKRLTFRPDSFMGGCNLSAETTSKMLEDHYTRKCSSGRRRNRRLQIVIQRGLQPEFWEQWFSLPSCSRSKSANRRRRKLNATFCRMPTATESKEFPLQRQDDYRIREQRWSRVH